VRHLSALIKKAWLQQQQQGSLPSFWSRGLAEGTGGR